jgi:hypothetical protein
MIVWELEKAKKLATVYNWNVVFATKYNSYGLSSLVVLLYSNTLADMLAMTRCNPEENSDGLTFYFDLTDSSSCIPIPRASQAYDRWWLLSSDIYSFD